MLVLMSISVLITDCAGLRVGRNFKVAPYDWVTMGGSPTRANQSPTNIEPPLVQLWQYNSVGGILATPLVRDSIVVLGTLNGEIQVVNLANGKRLAYLSLEGPVVGTPVWDGNTVIVPLSTTGSSLISLGLDGPDRPWSLSLGPIESSPLIYEQHVYVTTLEGQVFAVNRADGSEVWRYKTDTKEKRKPIRSSPASDGERIYFGSDDGNVYAVDRKEGKIQWKYQTGGSVFASPVLWKDAVVVGSLDGNVYALDAKEGNLRWKFDAKARVYGSAATDGRSIFFGTADGSCFSVNAQTGILNWVAKTKSVINSAPLVAGNILFVGSLDKTLYAYRASTGEELWQYPAPGRIRVSPVCWGNVLLVASEDRYVIALKRREVL
jgi:outer membrane protein assembly factor BamB